MGFVNRGGLTALLAIIVIGGCVAALMPKIFWAKTTAKLPGPDPNATVSVTLESSLWQTCVSSGSHQECSEIEKFHEDDYKTESTAERDGAIAGLVLGGLFCVATLISLCCRSKCASVTMMSFAVVCLAATVGCYYRFKTNSLDGDGASFDFSTGFYVACVTFALGCIAAVTSCCTNPKGDSYVELA